MVSVITRKVLGVVAITQAWRNEATTSYAIKNDTKQLLKQSDNLEIMIKIHFLYNFSGSAARSQTPVEAYEEMHYRWWAVLKANVTSVVFFCVSHHNR